MYHCHGKRLTCGSAHTPALGKGGSRRTLIKGLLGLDGMAAVGFGCGRDKGGVEIPLLICRPFRNALFGRAVAHRSRSADASLLLADRGPARAIADVVGFVAGCLELGDRAAGGENAEPCVHSPIQLVGPTGNPASAAGLAALGVDAVRERRARAIIDEQGNMRDDRYARQHAGRAGTARLEGGAAAGSMSTCCSGDETALPSIARRLEALPAGQKAIAIRGGR